MSEFINLKELCKKSREARKKLALTQKELAELLEVRQSSISQAENDMSGSMIKLQARIIEMAGWRIEGPFWSLDQELRQ